MAQQRTYLKISELSKLSGVSITRIRYYIQRQILFKPIKANKTTALYSQQHIERLKLIKEMHDEKRVAIASIKKMIDSITAVERGEQITQPNASQIIMDQIMKSSIPVFRKKGFERTTITDIVRAAGISRNTFYQLFPNKKELFIKCLEKLFLEWRQEAPDEITPIPMVMKKLALSFYRVYPRWSEMMNLFRASAIKYPDDFASRLEESLNIRIKPIVTDIERGIRQGLFREINSELAAMTLAGMLDYSFYFMSRGRFKDEKAPEIIDEILDIFFQGIMKR